MSSIMIVWEQANTKSRPKSISHVQHALPQAPYSSGRLKGIIKSIVLYQWWP